MLHRFDLSGAWLARDSDYQRGKPAFAQRDVIDQARYIPANVPGEIHLDLMKAGLIADVYRSANCLAARWVEEHIWSYRREFDAPAEARELHSRVWLYFEGLDYAAEIFLNGIKVGEHANFFRPCRVEVTGKLRERGNVLTVHLDSGLYHVADKPAEGYYHEKGGLLHKRHWLRKPQCQFSWDWSQRLINVGIHGRVWLEHTADTIRVDQLVPLVTVSDDLQTGQVMVRLFAKNLLDTDQQATLNVELAESAVKASTPVVLRPGLHAVEARLTLSSPKLWWPINHGDQPLYTVKTTLTIAGKTLAAPQKRIGFRHVRINQSTHPDKGSYFIVEINGKPIFCKGANFVPADMIFAAIDRQRYLTLIDRAVEANFNLLRVWGGGLYEHDDFYDLCDEKGILVWQDFIYACSRYPHTDADFFNEAKREASWQIRRLANHPSLVIWCGNNENEICLWELHWMKTGVIAPDYAFFHLALPRLMSEEDPTRYYQPSSPYSPRGLTPNADEAGDQHPWSVGFEEIDVRKYRKMICRFANEGGTLGPTSLPAMNACLRESQRFVQSFDWQVHDNGVDTWGEPSYVDRMTEFWLGRDCRKMTIEQYTYWAGLLQAEGLREYIDNFRRRMFDSAAAVFWMFNDCWPVVRSWTIVDYFLNRTPSFYPVRRAFEPVRIVLVEEDQSIDIYGINETSGEVSGDLRFGLFTIDGSYPLDRTTRVHLPPNVSVKLASFDKSLWADPNSQIAFAMLRQGDRLIARNRLILPLFKDLRWVTADIGVRMENGDAVFESRAFAFNVCLDLEGRQLPDNLFDLYPGIAYRLPWPSAVPPQIRFVGNLT